MKIKLPNGERYVLDTEISFEEKKETVENLLTEWSSIIAMCWNSNSVKYFLDSLSNYLVWHKDKGKKNRHNKEILSKTKLEQMNKFKGRNKQVNFTDLPTNKRELLLGERSSE